MKNKQVCDFIDNIYLIEDSLEKLKTICRHYHMDKNLHILSCLQCDLQNHIADYIDEICSEN